MLKMLKNLIETYRVAFFESDAEMYARIERETRAKLQRQFPSVYCGDL